VLSLLLAAAEPSKTPFYLAGGVLAVYAVLLAALGLARPNFPGGTGGQRAVIAVSFVLMVVAIAMAVTTDP
jgi:hypothetical protein